MTNDIIMNVEPHSSNLLSVRASLQADEARLQFLCALVELQGEVQYCLPRNKSTIAKSLWILC